MQVGGRDFALDLLFFHRGLNSLVAFELKVGRFEPEYLGKLSFYLEALDRDATLATKLILWHLSSCVPQLFQRLCLLAGGVSISLPYGDSMFPVREKPNGACKITPPIKNSSAQVVDAQDAAPLFVSG